MDSIEHTRTPRTAAIEPHRVIRVRRGGTRLRTALLRVQTVVTGATAATLAAAPRAIPSAFGLTLTPNAFLLCDLYAATEAALAFLSLAALRADDVRTVRLLCTYFVVVHAAEGAAGAYGVVQGLPVAVFANSAAHVVLAALFTRAAPRRAPSHRSAPIEDSEMPEPTVDGSRMRDKTFLVIGATGHVGSKITGRLAEKGYDVTAMVRRSGAVIEDPYHGVIKYVVGDLSDEASIRRALAGIDVVISTANGIMPQQKGDHATSVNDGAIRLIALCEAMGVERFVQSSVPTFAGDAGVPELAGKRRIEARLQASPMQSIIVRNAAFMDVFLVMGGFGAAADRSRHATTKRNYGFARAYTKFVGGLVEQHGLLLAPGGARHGTPTIATRDVAEMIVGAALSDGTDDLLIEASGPEWLTWRQIADIIGEKTGRTIRVLPLPAWLARLNQWLATPFSKPAANIFALMGFVASYQPRWDSADVVRRFNLPKQWTVSDYLDANYVRK